MFVIYGRQKGVRLLEMTPYLVLADNISKLYRQEMLTVCLFVLDQELLPKAETLFLKFSTSDQQPSLPFHNY